MLSKLQAKREKFDRKLMRLRSYGKASNVLFAAVFAAAVICPVVAAALLAASSAPIGAVGKWMSSLWKEYEDRVKKELDLVYETEIHTSTAIQITHIEG